MSNVPIYLRLGLLLCVSWLVMACMVMPTPSTRPDAADSLPTTATLSLGGEMKLEGVIVEIMESYPLQLVVETSVGRYQVALSEVTAITQATATRQQADLRVQMHVQITGSKSGANAMMAATIEISATP